MKIAFCASEMVPFAKTGGLADVVGALPSALTDMGGEVIVILPKYKAVRDAGIKLHKLSDAVFYAFVGKNIKTYFVSNDAYFNRDGLYQDKASKDYSDNLERFSYYARRALQLLEEINFQADIIHAHDWQAALIPVYLKTVYKNNPFYKNMKTILTIHNLGYQGLFPKEEFPKLSQDWSLFNMELFEFYGQINILKAGMIFSDIITTVSPRYGEEIQTEEFGFGLEGVLHKSRHKLFGILNGLDYSVWNPQTDKFIAKNYSLKNIPDKNFNKKDLQAVCGLTVKKDIPLLGMVSRLDQHKGFDILVEAIEKICQMNLGLVILGIGDIKYQHILGDIAKRYPKKISLNIRFDDPLAHKIYAGADIFLMPSKYEPCGLSQLISLKYGTLPLVFKTGGLADTVKEEAGFLFDKYNKEELIKTIHAAVGVFENKKKWNRLVIRAMQSDFSWEKSAKKYIRLYARLRSR